MPDNKEENIQFHLEEFRLLKAEILQNDKTKNQIEILIFSGIGIIYWFLLAYRNQISETGIRLVWFVPAFVSVFGYLWSRSFVWRSIRIGRYIKEIEIELALPTLGWERKIDMNRINYDLAINVIWAALTMLSIYIGILFAL